MRVVVSEQLWGQVIRDAAPPGIQVNVVTVALPSLHQVADPRGRRGTSARPRDPRLGLDRRVRRVRLPLRARGSRRALGALRARGRLPRAARLVEPVGRPHLRRLGVRLGRGDLVPPARAGRARTRAAAHVGRAARRSSRALADSGTDDAVRHAGRLDGRRDDRVLPDRVPGVERRARARRRAASASTRPRRPRRSRSCGA